MTNETPGPGHNGIAGDRLRTFVEQFGHFGPQPPRSESPCLARRRHRAGVRKAVNEALGVATAALPPPRPSFPLPPGTRTCRFIAGEKGVDFKLYADPGVFCGAAVQAGSAYCPDHHRRTHMRPYTKDGPLARREWWTRHGNEAPT